MSGYTEAKAMANQIARAGNLRNMFVSYSRGCEYCNSEDVEADMAAPTVEQLVLAVQKRLNELGTVPRLVEDGLMGPNTLKAILAALVKRPPL